MVSVAKSCYFNLGLCKDNHKADLETEVRRAAQPQWRQSVSITEQGLPLNSQATPPSTLVESASGNRDRANAYPYGHPDLTPKQANPPITPPQALASENASAKVWTSAEIVEALSKGQTDMLAYVRNNKPAEFEIVPIEAKLWAVFYLRAIPENARVYVLLERPDVVSSSLRALIMLLFDCSQQVVRGDETARCEQAAMYSGDDVRVLFDGLNRHGVLEDLLPTLSSCQRGKLVGTQ